MNVSASFGEVAGHFQMAEETGKGEHREAVGGKRFSERGIRIDEMFDAFEIARGGSLRKLQRGTGGEEEFTDFPAARVDGHKKRGGAGLIFGGSEGRVGVEKRADLGEVAGADGVEESFDFAHRTHFRAGVSVEMLSEHDRESTAPRARATVRKSTTEGLEGWWKRKARGLHRNDLRAG